MIILEFEFGDSRHIQKEISSLSLDVRVRKECWRWTGAGNIHWRAFILLRESKALEKNMTAQGQREG